MEAGDPFQRLRMLGLARWLGGPARPHEGLPSGQLSRGKNPDGQGNLSDIASSYGTAWRGDMASQARQETCLASQFTLKLTALDGGIPVARAAIGRQDNSSLF